MRKVVALVVVLVPLFAINVKKAYQESYRYEKMQDYKDAVKSLQPLLSINPNNYTLNLRLGWLYYLQGRYKNAIAHYRRAAMAQPKSFEPKLGLARVYLAKGANAKAFEIASAIIKQDLYNYYANYYAASALLGSKPKESEKIARKMLERYPTDALFLKLLGRALARYDIQKAKQVYLHLLILYPTDVEAKEFCDAHCGAR